MSEDQKKVSPEVTRIVEQVTVDSVQKIAKITTRAYMAGCLLFSIFICFASVLGTVLCIQAIFTALTQ